MYIKPNDIDIFWKNIVDNCKVADLKITNVVKKESGYSYDFSFVSSDKISVFGNGYFINKDDPYLIVLPGYMDSFKFQHLKRYVDIGYQYITIEYRDQVGRTKDIERKYKTYKKGLDDKNNFYLKDLAIDTIMLIKYIKTISSNVSLLGYSQGGGMSLLLGSYMQFEKIVCIFPSFSNNELRLENRLSSSRLFLEYIEENINSKDMVLNTISYYDTMNTVHNYKNINTLVILSYKDYICTMDNFFYTYENMKYKPLLVVDKNNLHTQGKHTKTKDILKFLKK